MVVLALPKIIDLGHARDQRLVTVTLAQAATLLRALRLAAQLSSRSALSIWKR